MNVSRRGGWGRAAQIMWAELQNNVRRWERRATVATLQTNSADAEVGKFVTETVQQGERLLASLTTFPEVGGVSLPGLEEARLGVSRRLMLLRVQTRQGAPRCA